MDNLQRYLRKKDDHRPVIPMSDVWIWSEALSRRDDMVEFYGPKTDQIPKGEGMPVPRPAPEAQLEVLSGDDLIPGEEIKLAPEEEGNVLTVDPNRIKAIVEAIGKLDPEKDYTKKTPQREAMPKVTAIEKRVGFKLEKGEREIALEAMKAAV